MRWLAARGHEISVVTADAEFDVYEYAAPVRVLRCALVARAAPGPFARRVRNVTFAMASARPLLGEAVSFRPDIVGALTPSASAASSALAAARYAGVPAWLHLEEGAEPLGIETGFSLVSLADIGAEALLEARGIGPEAGLALAPWIDTFAIVPREEPSPLRDALARADEIVALYVGECSEATARLLIAAARLVPPRGAIRFIAACAGAGLGLLMEAAHTSPRLAILSLPRGAALAPLLAAADIHLLPEGVSAADPLVPAKLGALLASGRPIVAVPSRCAVPIGEAVTAAHASGEGFAMAVVALAGDVAGRRRRGLAARAVAEAYFAKERVFRLIERRLEALAAHP